MVTEIDAELLHWIHLNRLESLDGILQWLTSATTYISLGMILLVLSVHRFRNPGWRMALQLAVILILSALLTALLKEIFERERPFYSHEQVQKLTDGGGHSFPSGHSLEVFAMAITMGLLVKKTIVWIILISWAMLIGYSRIALGVHYPGDVLGGMLTGIILAMVVNRIFTVACRLCIRN